MMHILIGPLRRWLSQDVARTNAAQASVRLQHHNRQVDDVDAFLAAEHRRQFGQWDGQNFDVLSIRPDIASALL